MRELTEFEKSAALHKNKIEAEQPNKEKLVARQRVKPGLDTWEYNTVTTELQLAVFKKGDVQFHPGQATEYTTHRKLDIQPDCKYFQALNTKNAVKKMWKEGHTKFIVLNEHGQRVAIDLESGEHGE